MTVLHSVLSVYSVCARLGVSCGRQNDGAGVTSQGQDFNTNDYVIPCHGRGLHDFLVKLQWYHLNGES